MQKEQGSPVWGGGTIGLFIGLIVGLFNGNLFKSITYGVLIGALVGFLSIFLAAIGNRGKTNLGKADTELTQKEALKILNKMSKAKNVEEGKKVVQKSMKNKKSEG